MASWERLVNTTITEHSRDVEENTMRDHKFLAKLRAKGRITYGHGGAGNSTNNDFDWRVKFAQGALAGIDDADTVSFERLQRYQIARLPWRGYSMEDSMSKKEKLQNTGESSLINYFSIMGDELLQDAAEQIHDEFYVDGNATGNGKRFHGLESFLATAGGESASTLYPQPTDSYAGLNTTLADKGGSWLQGTWPQGSGQAEYDYWAPKFVNWSSTSWGTASALWTVNANIVLRRALTHSRASKGKKGMIETVLMDRELVAGLKDLNETRQRIVINRSQPDGLVALGFNDVIDFEGVELAEEFAVPQNCFYGINWNHVELRLLNEDRQLFAVEGPEYDMKTKAYLLSIDCYGNLKFNPRAFFKGKNYA